MGTEAKAQAAASMVLASGDPLRRFLALALDAVRFGSNQCPI